MPGTIRAKRLRLVGAHVATLAMEARKTGVDAEAEEARRFLDLLAEGRLQVADLVDVVVDPREAETFYRRLARGRNLVGARLDWSVLTPGEGEFWTSTLRLPDMRARGTDSHRRLLRLAPESDDGDPFADAAGRLRIGLVGCGDVVGQNAGAIEVAPNVELVASYDPVVALAEDVAAEYGGDVEHSYEALLDRADVDAVLLSVPHHLHLPLGAAAATSGKHLIVEKPLANDLSSAVELVRAAEQADVVLSVCFPQRYEPAAVAARRLVEQGALGDPMGVLLTFWADKLPSYWVGGYSGLAPLSWRESRTQAGGGVLIMNLCHYVDLIRYVGGLEAELVLAQAQPEDAAAEVEDSVSVTVRYGGGAIGTLCASSALRERALPVSFACGARADRSRWSPTPRSTAFVPSRESGRGGGMLLPIGLRPMLARSTSAGWPPPCTGASSATSAPGTGSPSRRSSRLPIDRRKPATGCRRRCFWRRREHDSSRDRGGRPHLCRRARECDRLRRCGLACFGKGSIPYAAVGPGDSIVFADGRSLPFPPGMDADTAVARALISVARSAAAAVEDVSADSIDVVGAGIVASATRSYAGIPNGPPAARRPAAIVEATGEAANIREACGRVEDLGIVVLAGETNRRAVELNLYPDVHVRGLTLVGVPRPSEEDLLRTLDTRSEETEAACLAALTRAQSGAPLPAGTWFRIG